MKKWSSQWTQFMQLGKEAWKKIQAPVVQTLDSAILRINHYPVDKH